MHYLHPAQKASIFWLRGFAFVHTLVWPLPHRPVQLGWTCQECETPTNTALGVIEAHKPSHHFKVHAPSDGEHVVKYVQCFRCTSWKTRKSHWPRHRAGWLPWSPRTLFSIRYGIVCIGWGFGFCLFCIDRLCFKVTRGASHQARFPARCTVAFSSFAALKCFVGIFSGMLKFSLCVLPL